MRSAMGVGALAIALGLLAGCRSEPAVWKSTDLKNGLVTLQVVPQIGGRVIQYKLGEHGFFWVNPELVNSKPPASGVGPDNAWLNYGGDKLWPAPQGWDNDQQWPGPPDGVLDGGRYEMTVAGPAEKPEAVTLTSREDARSGIQFSRTIRIAPNSTRVSVDATMKNIDTRPRRWGIWAHTQLDASNRNGPGHHPNFWAYCPINPRSLFPRGYDVLYGMVGEGAYQPDYAAKLMRVHYQRRVGKIGLDSPAGWVATVDGTGGYVFVQRFTWEEGKPYPDNSSVEFWMNGEGSFVAWGKVNTMSPDPRQNPYIFEAETISPFAALKPGETASYHYEWAATCITPGMPVVDCSPVGVICQPLVAQQKEGRLSLQGHFGVFCSGTAKVEFVDDGGAFTDAGCEAMVVDPLHPFDIRTTTAAIRSVPIPSSARHVAVRLYDSAGKLHGELARAKL